MTTKILTATNLRKDFFDSIKQVEKGNMIVITRDGKAKTALVDLDYLEDLLEANDPKLQAELKLAQRQAKRGQVISADEVFAEFA